MAGLLGKWRFESSTNDEQMAAILSYPADAWEKVKAAKPEYTYTHVGGSTYHVKSVDIFHTHERDMTLGEQVEDTFHRPDGTEGKMKVTLTQVDDNTWKELCDYQGTVIEFTMNVEGDTMNITFSCGDISGTCVCKKVK